MCSLRLAGALLALLIALAGAAPPADAAPTDADMAFCTLADVTAKYPARTLAQRLGDAAGVVIDDGKLQDDINAFAAVMAPYVRERYGDTDFGTAEPTLNAMNVEGAFLETGKRKPLGLTDQERSDLKDLMQRVRDIARGHVALVLPAAEEDQDAAAQLSAEGQFWAPERLFGRSTRPSGRASTGYGTSTAETST